jgi:hypothetical protein
MNLRTSDDHNHGFTTSSFRDFFLACGNIGVANCTIDLIPRGAFIVKRSDASGSITPKRLLIGGVVSKAQTYETARGSQTSSVERTS